jgi:NAD+ kinase
MKLKSVAFAVNPTKKDAKLLRKKIAAYLRKNKIAIRRHQKAQILITIGGDGTILYNQNRYKMPVWAIGSSTSFICQSNYKRWKKDLDLILKNGFFAEKRLMLSARLNGFRLPDALNEIVVRSQYHRVLELELIVGKRKHYFLADGLIFTTPTGSTAYAYSAGGKQMKPNEWRYQVVPIAPYRRKFKPMLVGKDKVCRLKVIGKMKADVVVDGQAHWPIKRDSELVVRVCKRKFEFVRPLKKK